MESSMTSVRRAAIALACAALVLPGTGFAQSVKLTRSILEDQPYTLIYPEAMIASGGMGEPLNINHPDAPLQCDLVIVPVEETNWTPEDALDGFDAAEAAAEWSEVFPGFIIEDTEIRSIQGGLGFSYVGRSTGSPMGIPITLVHLETVASGRGYLLDCLYASSVAENAWPIVDFILSNFSTRPDAECCIGAEPADQGLPID